MADVPARRLAGRPANQNAGKPKTSRLLVRQRSEFEPRHRRGHDLNSGGTTIITAVEKYRQAKSRNPPQAGGRPPPASSGTKPKAFARRFDRELSQGPFWKPATGAWPRFEQVNRRPGPCYRSAGHLETSTGRQALGEKTSTSSVWMRDFSGYSPCPRRPSQKVIDVHVSGRGFRNDVFAGPPMDGRSESDSLSRTIVAESPHGPTGRTRKRAAAASKREFS